VEEDVVTSVGNDSGKSTVWLSPGARAPARYVDVDDRTTAADALAKVRGGAALIYRGDYRNARQLLAAMGRRLVKRSASPAGGRSLRDVFLEERRQHRLEHETLSRLAVPIVAGQAGPRVDLKNAPDVAAALNEALGESLALPGALPLRDLLGMIGAHEWRSKGVEVPALGAHLRTRWGVFAPVRGEHVELTAEAVKRWPVAGKRALDVGTGTGVLALLLARGGAHVTATDLSPAAAACARENATRLGLADRIEVVETDLFPEGRFDVLVCNPPWLPHEAVTPLDRAVYDPGGQFLARFLGGLAAHLAPGGEGWLILSDLAERLGLRAEGELEGQLEAAGLEVAGGIEAAPRHPRSRDQDDPLHQARSEEVTALRRLVARGTKRG
jgi:methylase of polypeptide subunit release factors